MEEMPAAGFDKIFMPKRMVLVCTSSNTWFMLPFLWNFFLIMLCTVYAFKVFYLRINLKLNKFLDT